MRRYSHLALLLALPLAGSLHAQQLATTCHASSSYDLTVRPDSLLFDRSSAQPQRVVLQHGELTTDGARVSLNAEDQDRVVVFERNLRALLPQVRRVARQGVGLAVQTLQEQAAELHLSAATRAELDRRLASHAAEIRRRIDTSNSTHDWQGDAAQQLGNQIVADLMPLVAGDLGQQALNAAMSGDLDTAARLRDQAANLAATLQPRLQQRMQALQPQVQALCPAVQRLGELQQDVRGSDGRPLQLLQVDTR